MNIEEKESCHYFQKAYFELCNPGSQRQAGNAARKLLTLVDAELKANAVSRKAEEVEITGRGMMLESFQQKVFQMYEQVSRPGLHDEAVNAAFEKKRKKGTVVELPDSLHSNLSIDSVLPKNAPSQLLSKAEKFENPVKRRKVVAQPKPNMTIQLPPVEPNESKPPYVPGFQKRDAGISRPHAAATADRPPLAQERGGPTNFSAANGAYRQPTFKKGFSRNSSSDYDEDAEGASNQAPKSAFVTAKQQFVTDKNKKNFGGSGGGSSGGGHHQQGAAPPRKNLGGRAASSSVRGGKFSSPLLSRKSDDEESIKKDYGYFNNGNPYAKNPNQNQNQPDKSSNPLLEDDRLKGFDPKLIELVSNEMLDRSPKVEWEDIAGLEHAKKSITEIVVWPMLKPEIFTGLLGPPKGLLLFGPPGTGKTLIGKCIASQAHATFFSISASSLTSKWIGEGEKMVRVLFAVARCHQPAVIFMDEIDSLLCQRTDGENEANRRIKTEFLVQFDGAGTNSEDRILIIGATNRPHEIDEAARRRLSKRLYIPLPESGARGTIVTNLMSKMTHCLTEDDLAVICQRTDGYSGSDMANLCKEAAMGPIRDITDIRSMTVNDLRPMNLSDFEYALTQVRASVSSKDLDFFVDWNQKFGSLG